MTKKNIIVVGGGISGSATLHYLKSKYGRRDDVQIRLLEKNPALGGTATTLYPGNCIFETGPNGFLDSKENTLQFVRDLNLDEQLLPASPSAKKRFFSIHNKLHLVPQSPPELIFSKVLSLSGKLRILKEKFVAKGIRPEETVYEFGVRRFGREFTEVFMDSMVSGIFAGNIRELNLKLTFPRIYEIEQRYGSLMNGMKKISAERKISGQSSKVSPFPGGRLTSFQSGMSQLGLTIASRYKDSILLNQEVRSIEKKEGKFLISSPDQRFEADELFLCVPAYAASQMLKGMDSNLSRLLEKIHYASVAVVGLVYERSAFLKIPEGFGYLIPSKEGKKVLGVLFESNIFPNRSDHTHFLFRVMIGGALHPDIQHRSDQELVQMAQEELQRVLQSKKGPTETFVKLWAKAIPQYDKTYFELHSLLENELKQEPGFFVVSNYRGGASLNDCIMNAKTAAQNSRL